MKNSFVLFFVIVLLVCCSKKSSTPDQQMPRCEVTPTALNFGNIQYHAKKTKSFTVKNIGRISFSGTLAVVDESHPGVFSIPEANRNYTLYPGQSFDIHVTFWAGVGQWNATIETGNSCCTDVYCQGKGHW